MAISNPAAHEMVPKRPAIPAWLLSAVVHLLLFIVLSIGFQRVQHHLGDEQERKVGIVLAHANAQQEVEFLDEADSSAEASQSEPSAAAPPLPREQTEPPIDPDIKLPGKLDTSLGASLSDELVAVPSLKPGTGRSGLSAEEEAAILAADAARPRRMGPSGPSAQIGVFGGPNVEGHSFVFVIDRSKSMGTAGLGALGRAAQELYANLSKLQPHHKFQILAYNHTPHYVSKKRQMLPATKENLHKIPEYFNNLTAFGRTNHLSALLAALRLNPDAVFLLTDGDPNLTEAQMIQVTNRAGGQTSIHCIQFGAGPRRDDESFMPVLAARNSGNYSYVDMLAKLRGR